MAVPPNMTKRLVPGRDFRLLALIETKHRTHAHISSARFTQRSVYVPWLSVNARTGKRP